jgi:hypothetical protein
MSVEGLWTTEIFGLWGWEHRGVLVLRDGRALGGGNNHHSTGRYSENGREVSVSLQISYHGTPRTMFGATERDFKLEMTGSRKDGRIAGEMCRADRPELKLPFRLTRRADLS